jgi:ribosome biogenesis GTPase
MARRRLTEQQRARIAKIQAERRQRVATRAEAALDQAGAAAAQSGQVVARHGQNLVVAGTGDELVHCLFRANLEDVVCGDQVVWQTTGSGEGVVTAVEERRSVLARPDYSGRDKPIAANVSQLVIVIAPRPEPAGYLVDQYLVAAELAGMQALLTINKSDLLEGAELAAFRQRFRHYPEIGYPLVQVSAKREHGLDPLIERLRGHTSILVGQSGVGKSSLINALIPDQDVQVGRLSRATGLGRHTTSTATLYHLPTGGELIDSPGVRSFRLGRIVRQQLEQGFRDFRPYLGHCGFRNCRHEAEPDCAILAAVAAGHIHPDRLATFRQLAQGLPG